MGLEKEIKSSFKSENQKLMVNIVYTSNWINTKHSQLLKPFGISVQQYNILRILRGVKKPCSIQILSERMLDKNSNASRLVEKLRLKNYVERVAAKSDRRQVNVTITDKGISILHSLDTEFASLNVQLSHLNEAEAKFVNEVLDKIRNY